MWGGDLPQEQGGTEAIFLKHKKKSRTPRPVLAELMCILGLSSFKPSAKRCWKSRTHPRWVHNTTPRTKQEFGVFPPSRSPAPSRKPRNGRPASPSTGSVRPGGHTGHRGCSWPLATGTALPSLLTALLPCFSHRSCPGFELPLPSPQAPTPTLSPQLLPQLFLPRTAQPPTAAPVPPYGARTARSRAEPSRAERGGAERGSLPFLPSSSSPLFFPPFLFFLPSLPFLPLSLLFPPSYLYLSSLFLVFFLLPSLLFPPIFSPFPSFSSPFPPSPSPLHHFPLYPLTSFSRVPHFLLPLFVFTFPIIFFVLFPLPSFSSCLSPFSIFSLLPSLFLSSFSSFPLLYSFLPSFLCFPLFHVLSPFPPSFSLLSFVSFPPLLPSLFPLSLLFACLSPLFKLLPHFPLFLLYFLPFRFPPSLFPIHPYLPPQQEHWDILEKKTGEGEIPRNTLTSTRAAPHRQRPLSPLSCLKQNQERHRGRPHRSFAAALTCPPLSPRRAAAPRTPQWPPACPRTRPTSRRLSGAGRRSSSPCWLPPPAAGYSLSPFCFPVLLSAVTARSDFHKTEQVLKREKGFEVPRVRTELPPFLTPKILVSPPVSSPYERPTPWLTQQFH
ncbi:proline-rich protein 36-like [Lathamus discolor]|uniref:proline-rich protein 36-like n=1 Tax=Lathamus discolor TaxID=678569 RepID=UPI0032B823F6